MPPDCRLEPVLWPNHEQTRQILSDLMDIKVKKCVLGLFGLPGLVSIPHVVHGTELTKATVWPEKEESAEQTLALSTDETDEDLLWTLPNASRGHRSSHRT